MDAKTTKFIGSVVGTIVGFFVGNAFSKPAEVATTELIDKVDKDNDDVNALSGDNKKE